MYVKWLSRCGRVDQPATSLSDVFYPWDERNLVLADAA
jgi:hypothetical protein